MQFWHVNITEASKKQHLLFIEVDSVVVQTTSISTTSRMLSVLACEVDKSG